MLKGEGTIVQLEKARFTSEITSTMRRPLEGLMARRAGDEDVTDPP